MNSLARATTLIAAPVAGLALGYALGGSAAAPPPSHSNTSQNASSTHAAMEASGLNELRSLSSLSEAVAKDRLLALCASGIPVGNIADALQRLGPFADPVALTLLFKRWAEEDPEQAAAFFSTFDAPDESAQWISGAILKAWAGKDASKAAEFASAQVETNDSKYAIEELWRTLAHHDPPGAFAKALRRLAPMEEIFAEWSLKDPAAAAAALEKIPPGSRMESAASAVLDAAMKRDPRAALEWFRTVPDSIRAAVGMSRLLGSYKDAPPDVRFSLLGEQFLLYGHHDGSSQALRAVRQPNLSEAEKGEKLAALATNLRGQVPDMAEWALKDPAGAAKWADSFPDPDVSQALSGQFAIDYIAKGRIEEAEQRMARLPVAAQLKLVEAAAQEWKNSAQQAGDASAAAARFRDPKLGQAFLKALEPPAPAAQ